MQIIACKPETPRYSPEYEAVNVFALQEKVIDSILADVQQQEAVAVVSKKVSDEQIAVSEIFKRYQNDPAYDRDDMRELRKFLKQPLVGASVQQLRNALKGFGVSQDVSPPAQRRPRPGRESGDFCNRGASGEPAGDAHWA